MTQVTSIDELTIAAMIPDAPLLNVEAFLASADSYVETKEAAIARLKFSLDSVMYVCKHRVNDDLMPYNHNRSTYSNVSSLLGPKCAALLYMFIREHRYFGHLEPRKSDKHFAKILAYLKATDLSAAVTCLTLLLDTIEECASNHAWIFTMPEYCICFSTEVA